MRTRTRTSTGTGPRLLTATALLAALAPGWAAPAGDARPRVLTALELQGGAERLREVFEFEAHCLVQVYRSDGIVEAEITLYWRRPERLRTLTEDRGRTVDTLWDGQALHQKSFVAGSGDPGRWATLSPEEDPRGHQDVRDNLQWIGLLLDPAPERCSYRLVGRTVLRITPRELRFLDPEDATGRRRSAADIDLRILDVDVIAREDPQGESLLLFLDRASGFLVGVERGPPEAREYVIFDTDHLVSKRRIKVPGVIRVYQQEVPLGEDQTPLPRLEREAAQIFTVLELSGPDPFDPNPPDGLSDSIFRTPTR